MGELCNNARGQRADVINTREKSKWLLALTMHFVLFQAAHNLSVTWDSRSEVKPPRRPNFVQIFWVKGRTGVYKNVRCWSLFLQQSVVHYDIIVLEFGLRADFITWRRSNERSTILLWSCQKWAHIFSEMGLIPIPDKPSCRKCFVTSYPSDLISYLSASAIILLLANSRPAGRRTWLWS